MGFVVTEELVDAAMDAWPCSTRSPMPDPYKFRHALKAVSDALSRLNACSPISDAAVLERAHAADMTLDDVRCAVRLYRAEHEMLSMRLIDDECEDSASSEPEPGLTTPEESARRVAEAKKFMAQVSQRASEPEPARSITDEQIEQTWYAFGFRHGMSGVVARKQFVDALRGLGGASSEPEPARDLLEPLSERERGAVERWAGREPNQHDQVECDAAVMAVALDKRFPKPAEPVDPVAAVLAEMRSDEAANPEGEGMAGYWADKLEAALKSRGEKP